MKNHKKRDNITVNKISAPNEVKSLSNESVGNAGNSPFCVYAGMRHAVGSVITKEDGSQLLCTENGSWQNI